MKCLFNDNGDGTFCIIGKRKISDEKGRYPCIVVSANPIVPGQNSPPVAPAQSGSKPRAAVRSSVLIYEGNGSQDAAIISDPSDASDAWAQISRFLPNHGRDLYPESHPNKSLLLLPTQRDIPAEWIRQLSLFRSGDADSANFTALILYLVGVKGGCSNCNDERDDLPFDECVALPSNASAPLRSYFGTQNTRCCNCFSLSRSRPCMFVRAANESSQLRTRHGRDSSIMSPFEASTSRWKLGPAGIAPGDRKRLKRRAQVVDLEPDSDTGLHNTLEPSSSPQMASPTSLKNRFARKEGIEAWEVAPGHIRTAVDGRSESKTHLLLLPD